MARIAKTIGKTTRTTKARRARRTADQTKTVRVVQNMIKARNLLKRAEAMLSKVA